MEGIHVTLCRILLHFFIPQAKLATHRISLLPYFKQVFTFILNTTIKEKEGNELVFRVRFVASSNDDDAVEEMIGRVYGCFD